MEVSTAFITDEKISGKLLTDGEVNYKSKPILSTIHSSNGLEYDTVYLMDEINGVFPSKIISFKSASPKEKRDYDEERRIFYVRITRAKDKLCIFKYGDEASIFVSEINPEEKPAKKEHRFRKRGKEQRC